jgi:hypothetical protein
LVFLVVSFLLAFPPISYMHSSSPPFVLHALPITSALLVENNNSILPGENIEKETVYSNLMTLFCTLKSLKLEAMD